MRVLIFCVLALTLSAKDRAWTPAVVESSSRERWDNGASSPYGVTSIQSIRESIYLDAGEWLYHATQITAARAALNLPDGARVEVAEDGKNLILRFNGKEHKLKMEQRSHGKKKSSTAH